LYRFWIYTLWKR